MEQLAARNMRVKVCGGHWGGRCGRGGCECVDREKVGNVQVTEYKAGIEVDSTSRRGQGVGQRKTRKKRAKGMSG